MVTTTRLIFPNACGAGDWRAEQQALRNKKRVKGKKAVGIWSQEGWDNTMETASVYDLQASLFKAVTLPWSNYAPQPGLTKPRRLWQELGLLQEGLFVTTQLRWAEGSVTTDVCSCLVRCSDLPGCCLPLPLSLTQWFFGLTQTRTYAGREFWKTQSYLSQRDTIQIHHA